MALMLALFAAAGCKERRKPRPKELASLSPEAACRHFFARVRTCSGSITRIQADKLGLRGPQRQAFLRQRQDHLARAFRAPGLICERYALKTRKQQTDMDRCYRERTCDAFAECFVQMADAEVSGQGGKLSLPELRKRLQELKRTRPPGPKSSPEPRPGPTPKPMPKPRPEPKP
jgi:hypothetical protein